jgi:hypothetical protein
MQIQGSFPFVPQGQDDGVRPARAAAGQRWKQGQSKRETPGSHEDASLAFCVAKEGSSLAGQSRSSGGGVQLLGCDLGGGAGAARGVLAFIFEQGEDLAGLVGVALGLVELG